MERNVAIFLRHFRYSDIEVLRSQILPGYSDDEIFKTLEQWNTHEYDDLPFEMYAICANTTIVGSLTLRLCDDYATVCLHPEILPKFRRKGYAKAAMAQAIELLRTHEYVSLSAQIPKDNVASIRLHEALGYKRNGESVNSPFLTYTMHL